MSEDFVAVAKTADVPAGKVRVVEHGNHRIALCNVDGTIYAVEDTCTHDDGPLGEGVLDGCAIECPRHGAKFDVRTGEVLQMPAVFPIRKYETKIEGDTVLIKVET